MVVFAFASSIFLLLFGNASNLLEFGIIFYFSWINLLKLQRCHFRIRNRRGRGDAIRGD